MTTELSPEDRESIVRDGATLLERTFDDELFDRISEALYRRGFDTLEDEDAQDLVSSLQIEALSELATQVGWKLVPSDDNTGFCEDHGQTIPCRYCLTG